MLCYYLRQLKLNSGPTFSKHFMFYFILFYFIKAGDCFIVLPEVYPILKLTVYVSAVAPRQNGFLFFPHFLSHCSHLVPLELNDYCS